MENLNSEISTEGEGEACYGIVSNIPKEFRSADLRAMFSNFINGETEGFKCFHFRHRPEFRYEVEANGEDKEVQSYNTTCCVIMILKKQLRELIKDYHGKNWVDRSGKYFPSKAVISRIRIKEGKDLSYRTRQEKSQHSFARTSLEFSHHDLNELKELHPPPLMPNGNVGTPLSVFMELIRTCKLPPHVIKKLDLNFSACKSKKRYSNVPLDYKTLERDHALVARGIKRKLVPCAVKDYMQGGSQENDSLLSAHSLEMLEFQTSEQCNNENGSDCEELDKIETVHGDSDVEEWDRHESLHNDVTSQERTKERLFEEDIELKWEKGGSGLVFYTDAAFWKEQEEPTFDEETADDWDVDMEIYENPDGGDKDSRDLLQMRIEKQWRKGNDIDLNKIGGFEKYTRGFGGQLMRKQGWKEGGSLGLSQEGITEPVVAEGQLPKSKKGLGYHGEKLQRHVKWPKAQRNVISTIYDEPDNNEENVFESWGPNKLKYVNNVDFVRGKSHPEQSRKI